MDSCCPHTFDWVFDDSLDGIGLWHTYRYWYSYRNLKTYTNTSSIQCFCAFDFHFLCAKVFLLSPIPNWHQCNISAQPTSSLSKLMCGKGRENAKRKNTKIISNAHFCVRFVRSLSNSNEKQTMYCPRQYGHTPRKHKPTIRIVFVRQTLTRPIVKAKPDDTTNGTIYSIKTFCFCCCWINDYCKHGEHCFLYNMFVNLLANYTHILLYAQNASNTSKLRLEFSIVSCHTMHAESVTLAHNLSPCTHTFQN